MVGVDLPNLVVAAKVLSSRSGVFGSNSLPDEVPPRPEVTLRASELEVVHHKHQLKLGVPEAGPPVRDGLRTHGQQVLFAVPFPVPSGVGVPVERED